MTRTLAALGLLLGGLTAGCAFRELEPLPLRLELSVDRTAAVVGQDFVFTIDAQGNNLLGITVNYGDGATSQFEAFGSRTYTRTDRHSYDVPGVYIVRATVEEASSGTASQEVTVEVTLP